MTNSTYPATTFKKRFAASFIFKSHQKHLLSVFYYDKTLVKYQYLGYAEIFTKKRGGTGYRA